MCERTETIAAIGSIDGVVAATLAADLLANALNAKVRFHTSKGLSATSRPSRAAAASISSAGLTPF